MCFFKNLFTLTSGTKENRQGQTDFNPTTTEAVKTEKTGPSVSEQGYSECKCHLIDLGLCLGEPL